MPLNEPAKSKRWYTDSQTGFQYRFDAVRTDSLHDWYGNLRDVSPSHVEEIRQSAEQFGIINPIVVWPHEDDGRNFVLGGNHRWRAAQKLGITEIPAKIYHPDTPEYHCLHLAEEDNKPLKKVNFGEECRNMEDVRETIKEEWRNSTLSEWGALPESEAEEAAAAGVDIDDKRERCSFIFGELINNLRETNPIGENVSDERVSYADLEGEGTEYLTAKQLGDFIRIFGHDEAITHDDENRRDDEATNIAQLCRLLAEEAISGLEGQSYIKPDGSERENGRVILFTNRRTIRGFGYALAEIPGLFDSHEEAGSPLYTDPDAIDWETVKEAMQIVPEINWEDDLYQNSNIKRLKKVLLSDFAGRLD